MTTWGRAGEPLAPVAPVEQPLVFDYPHGINLIAQPRAGFGLHSFAQLRLLAEACEELRLPVELLKREIRALEWEVVPRDDAEPAPERLQAAQARLALPDGLLPFDAWVNMLLEELLVTDAVTLYPNLTRGGEVGDLELIDGATIRPLLDARGRTPAPPLPGYAQIIKGVPVGQWTRAALWYLPYNRTIRHPYGRPPAELVILTVNTALRRATGRLGQYTEGNIPEALVGLPADWSVNDISAFQEYWDALMAADQQRLQRMKFFPVGGTGTPPVYEFRRSDGETVVLDEWLLRVGCWAVGVSPAELGLVPGDGLGGAGFAEGQADVQYRMGLGPITQYLKGICDLALAGWGFTEMEFQWTSTERPEDAMVQAQIDEIRLRTGIYDLAYVQEREGIPPENRPEQAPTPQSPFPLSPFQMTAGGDLRKAADADDPNGEPKMGLATKLREALLEYFAGLRERVAEAALEVQDAPTG
jgi:hypothetical protein